MVGAYFVHVRRGGVEREYREAFEVWAMPAGWGRPPGGRVLPCHSDRACGVLYCSGGGREPQILSDGTPFVRRERLLQCMKHLGAVAPAAPAAEGKDAVDKLIEEADRDGAARPHAAGFPRTRAWGRPDGEGARDGRPRAVRVWLRSRRQGVPGRLRLDYAASVAVRQRAVATLQQCFLPARRARDPSAREMAPCRPACGRNWRRRDTGIPHPTQLPGRMADEAGSGASSPKARAFELKAEGNQLFAKKEYDAAVAVYDEALELDPANHVRRAHAPDWCSRRALVG